MKTIETYSRGLELIRDFHKAWSKNEKDRNNQRINERMEAIIDSHDLTLEEYYYWSKQSRSIL